MDDYKEDKKDKDYINVMFHNKGMDMIDLPRILNCRKVMRSVPSFVKKYSPILIQRL